MRGARGDMWAGKLLRLYSGLSGRIRRAEHASGAEAESSSSRSSRAQQPPEQPPTGAEFTQLSVGDTGQGGGLGARVQKNERALLPEGAKT